MIKIRSPATSTGKLWQKLWTRFYALTAILSKSNAEDIDADDMAKVLGALVHSAWVRTGYPRLGDAL